MKCQSCIVAIASTSVVFVGILGFAPAASAEQSWTMPNLTGANLQGAQDAIQALTADQVWFTTSIDLTGLDRAQINDRNWMVCTSTPPPGTQFFASTGVTFGVVRIDTEVCP